MEGSLKFQFFMSQLTHVRDIRDTEKTRISVVFYETNQSYCILRVCKNRDLSGVCRVLCKVRHPGAVVVYDYAYEAGSTYILEENLTGRTLEEMISQGRRFTEHETAQIMLSLCEALEPLHGQQPPLVHNDINPSNIMLREDGSVKLFDFDIARIYKKGAGQNTALFGTEEYASPEHYGYGQSEPRTDIYCMGVTMHKMLTGESLTAEHGITYRGKLKPIMEKCLRLDPKNRYKDVQALRRELQGFLTRKKRLLPALTVATTGILLLCLLLWGLSGTRSGEPDVPETQPLQQTLADDTISQQSSEKQDNHTRENAVQIAASKKYTVWLDSQSAVYYVLTVEQAGEYTLSLENKSVTCRVFYGAQRDMGSLCSGWTDQGESTSRTFLAQQGDLVYIRIQANQLTDPGECVLLVEAL